MLLSFLLMFTVRILGVIFICLLGISSIFVLIAAYALLFRRFRDVGFKTAPIVIWLLCYFFVPLGFANWAVMIRRLRDVGLKLKTMFIGWGLMAVLNIIILIVFSAGYGFTLGIIWGTIWNIGIDLIIQIIFLCLPTGAMATQKEDSKFFENKALY